MFGDEWRNDGTQPFLWANGDRTGYSFHGDFSNGWEPGVLKTALNMCTTGGTMGECNAVTEITDWAECRTCKKAPSVAENVRGPLSKLPGCNALTGDGETPGPILGCTETATLIPSATALGTATSRTTASPRTSTLTTSSRRTSRIQCPHNNCNN
ncbi:hypothetical protein K458DRAFT_429829 [Lentithecium fluviatile CBS 122367]|uniref:DUF1996 domain-containing protein n=1 Tax=Lentithecium fluviatile CBS 122367 TaxID=1168545 RepID=A0A6G1J8N6_9PLEO|nr:hypothetical protein K458DRAFT_429829 [Lentithecium fluviatile CBS 122367]